MNIFKAKLTNTVCLHGFTVSTACSRLIIVVLLPITRQSWRAAMACVQVPGPVLPPGRPAEGSLPVTSRLQGPVSHHSAQLILFPLPALRPHERRIQLLLSRGTTPFSRCPAPASRCLSEAGEPQTAMDLRIPSVRQQSFVPASN